LSMGLYWANCGALAIIVNGCWLEIEELVSKDVAEPFESKCADLQ